MKQSLVLTTINIPHLLIDYAKNFLKYGHQKDVEILVIGDLKTPEEVNSLIEQIQNLGVKAYYIDIPAQEKWLKRFPALSEIIPYNSDNRRNLGYLMAAEQGADIIVVIDDDNYVDSNQDFFKAHSIVGQTLDFQVVSAENGWFNICSMLKVEPNRTIYPRGFPYSKRWKEGRITYQKANGRIVINEGLWFGDPDIDSITRLTEDVKVTGVIKERQILDQGTYSPINTQNTAFHRDILPCAYFIIMGEDIRGLKIDRYGDIWFGLFAKKVIDQMKEYISFGKPFSIHRRNPHNLFKDLREELWAIILTDTIVEFLESTHLKSRNYSDCYYELAEQLERFASNNKSLDKEIQLYFKKISSAMKIWVEVSASL